MGISQQIGASSLIKPGVIDNTAARPASPYEGQVIFQKDTDQLLVWNGTAWVIPNSPAQNPQGLELVTTATCSSGGTATGGVITIGSTVGSVTVANAFSATYDNYKIIVSGGTNSTDCEGNLKLGSTTSGYHMSYIYTSWNGTVAGDGTKVGTQWNYVSGHGANNNQANIEVNSPFLAKNTRIFAGGFGQQTAYVGSMSGALFDTTQYTSFIFAPSAGNMTGGTIRVYGYRNS